MNVRVMLQALYLNLFLTIKMKNKKAQVKVTTVLIITLLILIAFVIVVIAVNLINKPTTGYVVNQNPQPNTNYNTADQSAYTSTNTNNNAEIINQAISYLRECILGCPKQCPSCGVLSYTCVDTCQKFMQSKVGNIAISGSNAMALLSDENSKWISCSSACQTTYPNDNNYYIDYDCIHNCRN